MEDARITTQTGSLPKWLVTILDGKNLVPAKIVQSKINSRSLRQEPSTLLDIIAKLYQTLTQIDVHKLPSAFKSWGEGGWGQLVYLRKHPDRLRAIAPRRRDLKSRPSCLR